MRATSFRTQRDRLAASTAALVLGVGLLGGCTSDGGDADAASAATPSLLEGDTESFATLGEGWHGVRSDVTVDACPTTAGDVTAQGTVVNSAAEPRDLSILVSWLAPDSADPLLQLEQTLADVPAGEARDWSATGALLSDAGQCLVGARSGVLDGG